MTTRADLHRLGVSTITLGELLRDRGEDAWDHMKGWEWGPRKAPAPATDDDEHGLIPNPMAEDHAIEMKQRQAAARHFAEHRVDLAELDKLVQRITRRIDVACPPNVSEMKNRKTGELEPITSADVAAAGWCASCWKNDRQMVVITVRAGTTMRYYRDYCRWCGDFLAQHKVEPPLELLKARHGGHRLSEAEVDKAVKAAIAAATPAKKGKRKKGKKAA